MFPRKDRCSQARTPRRPGLVPPAAWAWLAAACALLSAPARAQVQQLWSHQAAFGDASAAVAFGETLMFVCNNENEVLGLYARYPGSACKTVVYSLNVRPNLGATGSDLAADLESAVQRTDDNGTRIYWLGSLGNTKNGNLRPNRNRIFATTVHGSGSGMPPCSLQYLGRYDKLRDDILAWDTNNLHGLGANYFGLAASAASGVSSQSINGFNVEGLTLAPDGTTAYIGFRAPLVDSAGPTTALSARTHALVIPLLNMPALVIANPTPGPGVAQFGAPIRLPLGGRGIRSIDCTYPHQYLISAGPPDAVSNPPAAPLDFRLYTWSGDPLVRPVERAATFAGTYTPEGGILPNAPITESTIVQFVNDDGGGNGCWRSMTCTVGSTAGTVGVPPAAGPARGVRFSRAPTPNPARQGVSFAVEVAEAGPVELSVHDLAGRRVATLWDGDLPAGERGFTWAGVRAGVYWVWLRSAGVSETRRFALMR